MQRNLKLKHAADERSRASAYIAMHGSISPALTQGFDERHLRHHDTVQSNFSDAPLRHSATQISKRRLVYVLQGKS